jgi:GT2 family glycosyltransferase
MEELSIIIVTYKSNNNIINCIEKIKLFEKNIYIVDNSNDLILKKNIKKKFPRIKFFLNKKNLGYGKANNQMLNIINTKYALLLNPDTVITINSIYKLIKKAKEINEKFAILSPLKKNTDNIHVKDYYKPFSIFSNFNNQLMKVKSVNFHAPLFNIKVIKKIKFFDENFFLYLEDVDLCMRLIKNKENIFLLKTSIAKHNSGQSSSAKDYILIRYFHFGWSLIYYYKKHFGIIVSILVSFWYFFKINIKTFLYFLLKKNIFAENKSMLQGVFSSFFCKKDFFRNKY